MDWNNDGMNDLIVGEHNGHIKYFMAVTPDSLTEMDDIQAAGEDINAGLVSAPVVFDWNNDSKNDLIVGFASPLTGSSIKVYINTGTQANPVLAAGVDVLFGGEPLVAYGCAPCMTDLDQDGLTDIVYGDSPGRIYFCKNSGTVSAPVFDSPERLQTEEGDITLNLNSSPFVCDWNEDSYPDIVSGCGETGYVYAFLSPWTSGISTQGQTGSNLTATVLRNPVSSSLAVQMTSTDGGELISAVFSLDGRIVQKFDSRQIQPGSTIQNFNITSRTAGVYILRFSIGNSVSSSLITIIEGAI